MHLTKLTSSKRMGFSSVRLHTRRDVPDAAFRYMRQKSSFLIAALALVTFLGGNMLGQHGWHAFWASVLGGYDDSLIVYNGTVTPIAQVPNYSRWNGSVSEHTFKQVPLDALKPLPLYEVNSYGDPTDPVYSVAHLGSYAGGKGSHPGVDIRTPIGTPVRSVMNGEVYKVEENSGYGLYVTVRSPNVPDPKNPSQKTTIYTTYAHLSAQFVAEGDIVSKGQEIALTGQTGFATGPHLHFQMDNEDAPFIPYWPFTGSEMRSAGMSFIQAINSGLGRGNGLEHTLDPLLYVQNNYTPATVIAEAPKEEKPVYVAERTEELITPSVPGETDLERMARLRNERLQERLSRRRVITVTSQPTVQKPVYVRQQEQLASAQQHSAAPASSQDLGEVANVDIQHDRQFSGRAYETVRITLLDSEGQSISADALTTDLYLRTAWGNAEFEPATLSPLDFNGGSSVTVKMLPRGQQTVVIQVLPFGTLSQPMRYVQ